MNTIFGWLRNQGNRLKRRLGLIYIKQLARFEHPVDPVYQLMHSRRNYGFRSYALGLQTPCHVPDQLTIAHGQRARQLQYDGQLTWTGVVRCSDTFSST